MSNEYEVVGAASKKLGFHGICPESMAALRGMNDSGFLESVVRLAFNKVWADMAAMFEPVKPGFEFNEGY